MSYGFSIDFYFPTGDTIDPVMRKARNVLCAVVFDRAHEDERTIACYAIGPTRAVGRAPGDEPRVGEYGVPEALALYCVDALPIGRAALAQGTEVSSIHGIALTWARVIEFAHAEVLAQERVRAGHERHAGIG
jgi:hypothetical protein